MFQEILICLQCVSRGWQFISSIVLGIAASRRGEQPRPAFVHRPFIGCHLYGVREQSKSGIFVYPFEMYSHAFFQVYTGGMAPELIASHELEMMPSNVRYL